MSILKGLFVGGAAVVDLVNGVACQTPKIISSGVAAACKVMEASAAVAKPVVATAPKPRLV